MKTVGVRVVGDFVASHSDAAQRLDLVGAAATTLL